MKVTLVILAPLAPSFGGATTFVSHLYRTLLAEGHSVDVVKIGARANMSPRPYVYGIETTTHTLETLKTLHTTDAYIVPVIAPEFSRVVEELLTWKNTSIVIHDPRGIDDSPSAYLWGDRAIVIRTSNLRHLPKATFIPHPFVRSGLPTVPKTVFARAISRIDFNKKTERILEANRLLPKDKQIEIRGYENRFYSHHNIVPKFPEWVQGAAEFPKEADAAAKLMNETMFCVDLTYLKGDGGGTQYTFLEAIDVGAACIISNAWFKDVPSDRWEMLPGFSCIAVPETAEGMADVIASLTENDRACIAGKAAEDILPRHAPAVIGPMYTEFLERIAR